MAEVKLTAATVGNIPFELKALKQWVLWDWKLKPDGTRTKVPVQVTTDAPASSTDKNTWATFDDAWAAYTNQYGAGIGFVFTEQDEYVGIDFDDCVDWQPTSWWGIRQPESTWLKLLNTYTEYSPSGTGVKAIFKGKLPEGTRHGFGKGNGIYEQGRFFTITGKNIADFPAAIREIPEHELRPLLDVWFPEQQKVVTWEPQPERYTDNEVMTLANKASNGEKFRNLWRGTWGLAGYPSKSEADAGLCAMLAFYTGPNPAQIDRLFRCSNMFNEKWDENRGSETYGEKTIRYVLDNQEVYYGDAAVAGGEPGAADSGVPSIPAPAVGGEQSRWQRAMEGYPALTEGEMPWALRLLVRHIAPLASGFAEDWAEVSALGFISSLFPRIKFENLPLILWTLGISEQATGKSLVADELNELTHGVAQRLGNPLASYGSGSTAGMIRRLEGNNRAMLAYFSEWSSLMAEMERDFGSTMKDTLLNLYDGRSQQHVLATGTIEVNNPRLVVAGVTTVESWIRSGNMASVSDGFYSRLMFVAPDTWSNYTPAYRQDMAELRRRLVIDLGEHWGTLPEVGTVAFEGGEKPEVLLDYERKLGMVHDGPRQLRSLDEALLRTSETSVPGGRSIVRVKKVSALLALCEREPNIRRGTLWVSDEHIALAIRLVQRSNAYAMRVFGYLARSEDENQANAVRRALQRQGSLKIGGVMHHASLGKKKATAALELLIDDGEAETLIMAGVRYWRLK